MLSRVSPLLTRVMGARSLCTSPAAAASAPKWSALVKQHWDGAVPVSTAADELEQALQLENPSWSRRDDGGNSILALSVCSDEVHKLGPFESRWTRSSGSVDATSGSFNMGGLAGFPFAGVGGLGAFAAHVPDGGAGILVYGPHIGVSDKGVAVLDRHGTDKKNHQCSPSTCGAAIGAVDAIINPPKAEEPKEPSPFDVQLNVVVETIKAGGLPDKIPDAGEERDALYARVTDVLYDRIDKELEAIVDALREEASKKNKDLPALYTFGGITINTPLGHPDYFLVKDKRVYDALSSQ